MRHTVWRTRIPTWWTHASESDGRNYIADISLFHLLSECTNYVVHQVLHHNHIHIEASKVDSD